MENLQVIDISPFTSLEAADNPNKNDVLEAWDKAFSTLGFAIITGHGVPMEDILNLKTDTREFFGLEIDAKMKSCVNRGYGDRGFVPVGIESVGRSRNTQGNETVKEMPPDFVENICFHEGASGGDIVPDQPRRLRISVQKYWKHMQKLLSTVMEISALSLGLSEDYFKPFYTQPEVSLRLSFYPAQDKNPPKPNQIRYGAHTDYTGFTLLRPDDKVGGLEILDPKNSSWIPIHAKENCYIVNAGDLIQQWTNDHWISNLHQVVNPPSELAHLDRLSVVFFTGPNNDATIAPLDVCCTAENPSKYRPVNSGEYLQAKLRATNV